MKEVYLSALEDLSLEKTEVKVYTSEVRREMEEKISNLENQNETLKYELGKMDDIMERLSKLESKNG